MDIAQPVRFVSYPTFHQRLKAASEANCQTHPSRSGRNCPNCIEIRFWKGLFRAVPDPSNPELEILANQIMSILHDPPTTTGDERYQAIKQQPQAQEFRTYYEFEIRGVCQGHSSIKSNLELMIQLHQPETVVATDMDPAKFVEDESQPLAAPTDAAAVMLFPILFILYIISHSFLSSSLLLSFNYS